MQEQGGAQVEEETNPWAHCMVVWGNLLYEHSQFRCGLRPCFRPRWSVECLPCIAVSQHDWGTPTKCALLPNAGHRHPAVQQLHALFSFSFAFVFCLHQASFWLSSFLADLSVGCPQAIVPCLTCAAWTSCRAAVGADWKASLQKAYDNFKAAGCPDSDIRTALNAHARSKDIDFVDLSEPTSEGAASAAEDGAAVPQENGQVCVVCTQPWS